MKKRKIEKKNIKFIVIGLITGCIIAGCGVYAATYINAENVSYTNTTSGLSATNVQDALDEAYSKSDVRNKGNFISMYKYNASTCVTGEESTCVATKCYANYYAPSCSVGDIVKYKVNDTDIVTFHVISDMGTTLRMQAQKNTVYSSNWISESDYSEENTDSTSCSSATACADEGPVTVLEALESATAGWTNVNDLTYALGTTVFKTNAFTGCSSYSSCNTTPYKLSSRTAKARMITQQEVASLGCTTTNQSCPIWMHNYLARSASYGGTKNDTNVGPDGGGNYGYWTLSASTASDSVAWVVMDFGKVNSLWVSYYYGSRAVVEVHKQGYGNNA